MEKQFNYSSYNSGKSIEELQKLIADGFRYYVTKHVEDPGTDPGSGMPNAHLEYYAYDNQREASEAADNLTANIFDPNQKNTVRRLDDLLDKAQGDKKWLDNERARRDANAAKAKERNANRPEWDKVRTVTKRYQNEYNALKAQMEEAKKAYKAQLDKLAQAYKAAGIEVANVEDTLTTEWKKTHK